MLGLHALPGALRAALAEPAPRRSSLGDVEHVVILMQENRSFDHYFGSLSGVRGYNDPSAVRPSGRSVFWQADKSDPDGYVLPYHLPPMSAVASCVPDLGHSWRMEHNAWHHGAMDGWLPLRRTRKDRNAPALMGYYTRADLPFHYALADTFTVCDMYFASILSETAANRLYAMTGTVDAQGTRGGPVIANWQWSGGHLGWTTYPERLQSGGVSWRVYAEPNRTIINVLTRFEQYKTKSGPLWQNGIDGPDMDQFEQDARAGTLPNVSWILPSITNTEHPPYSPLAGAAFIRRILSALASNPDTWMHTVLFIVYDEHGGFFDHVRPPTAHKGTPGEWVRPNTPASDGILGPIGLGFRVPALVISPWSTGGYVCSDVFDHTSLLRFLETRFGVEEPNISAWRRRTCGDLTAALRFTQPVSSVATVPPLVTPSLTPGHGSPTCAPAAHVPRPQRMPTQEPGTRRRVG